ncbi:F-box/kelch-repeat protein family [Quillaja saponaria]|uniref:F-box/kelch-repeat protein family n=1 Tax=Quillaja saponaria TaxID=32244 RepID=A0AAD7M6I5_QUISA|nr:F-box/kelch-repeat protein family [Quillaja saponaria]
MLKEKGREVDEERENWWNDSSFTSKKGIIFRDSGASFWLRAHTQPPQKVMICDKQADLKQYEISTSKGSVGDSSGREPQDADYYVPTLSDELSLILARVSRSEYWKFAFVNKQFLTLLKSGELFKIRRQIGFKELSVFMSGSGKSNWLVFSKSLMTHTKLPDLPADDTFFEGDRESFCAGTHLMVSGRDFDGTVVGTVVWRYELETNQWFKGPSMITPRCLFASTTCGTFAFVAGGLTDKEVLNCAEKYNQETRSWESQPRMKQRRKRCSGCYMDNKFYVIGGQDEHDNRLTCGELFDEATNTWKLIPNMLEEIPASRSFLLIAVANNELYRLVASTNELKVYLKRSNSWKTLGPVPVRADANCGWGVAFKSLGDELLVMEGKTLYTCLPDPAAEKLQWKQIEYGSIKHNPFILNCCVMVA